jgi:hypothetical protein
LAFRGLTLVLSIQNVSHGRKLVVFRIVLLDWVSHYLALGLQVRVASLLHEIIVHRILQQFFELITSWRLFLPRQIKGPWRHMLIFWALSMLLLFHMKEF